MLHIPAYWCPYFDVNEYRTNFGDIMTPYILKQYGVDAQYTEIKPMFCGIGSILHTITDSNIKVWTSGFLFPTHTITNEIIAIRGKLSKEFTSSRNDPNITLGDGGLLISRVFNPSVKKIYKLGIVFNFYDEQQIDKTQYKVLSHKDVLAIYPYDSVEDVVSKILMCENIISSSLHGLVVADSYKIPNHIFCTNFSNYHIHKRQASFKFRDYYSIYDLEYNHETDKLVLRPDISLEECLASLLTYTTRPNIDTIIDNLENSIYKLKYQCIQSL